MTETWELDFYSRPILDEQDKKLWEVLVCNAERTFEFSRFCAGSEANARWLESALTDAMEQWRSQFQLSETATPDKIRFFRRPMNTIITRACESLNIPSQASRRAYALVQWLRERMDSVYPEHPGYKANITPPPAFEPTPAQPLPDALRGEGWAFVSLKFSDLAEMQDWDITFQERIPLSLLQLSADTVVPGLVIFSKRAIPLAGWMSGLEVWDINYETQPVPRLILETGL
ncbi:MAG TPA: Tab2/Atab2 family RNA-binding protein, partial [Stenomitos sp.]